MNKKLNVFAVLGMLAFSAAQARVHSINTDGWSQIPDPSTGDFTWTGSSVTATSALPDGAPLPQGLTFLSFASGTPATTYTVATIGTIQPRDMFVWRNPITNDSEQVIYVETSANSFTLDFNYADDAGCSGETASLQVNSLVFGASSPCTKGTEVTGISTESKSPYDYLNSHFSFDITSAGKVQLVGSSPWAGTVSAPEIDPNSAAAGLALLFGGLAVLRGRRVSGK
jgi:hypothetical protein